MAPPWWGVRGDAASLERFLVRVKDQAQLNTSQSGAVNVPYLVAVGRHISRWRGMTLRRQSPGSSHSPIR
jgi:hypothetical protein